ncbi:sterol carrier protein 2 [Bulinus truncatus]|nr:sterol carrier protein 2 [Bulinus truncatus]
MGFPKSSSKHSIQVVATSASVEKDFKSAAIFSEIKKALDTDGANIVKKIQGVFCFKVKGPENKEAVWVVDVKNGTGAVKFDSDDKADTTIIMADVHLFDLMQGKLNPQTAFMQGKLKIIGNMGLAMKLEQLRPKAGSKL